MRWKRPCASLVFTNRTPSYAVEAYDLQACKLVSGRRSGRRESAVGGTKLNSLAGLVMWASRHVSRSERGRSRPRQNIVAALAELFEIDARELLTAAGYAPTADRPDKFPFPSDRGRRYPGRGAESRPFRGAGRRRQRTACIRRPTCSTSAARATSSTGSTCIAQQGSRAVAAFQCKRGRQFGPKDVREAVR